MSTDFRHLIGRNVRREFVVGADGYALLQLARCEGRRQFQFPPDRAHRLGSRLIIAVQPLLEHVHAAGRQHLGQQLRVAFVVIEAHPDLIVEIEKVPRIAKHVVEVRNGDFADEIDGRIFFGGLHVRHGYRCFNFSISSSALA